MTKPTSSDKGFEALTFALDAIRDGFEADMPQWRSILLATLVRHLMDLGVSGPLLQPLEKLRLEWCSTQRRERA